MKRPPRSPVTETSAGLVRPHGKPGKVMELLKNGYFQAWKCPWKKFNHKSLGNLLYSHVHLHSLIKRIHFAIHNYSFNPLFVSFKVYTHVYPEISLNGWSWRCGLKSCTPIGRLPDALINWLFIQARLPCSALKPQRVIQTTAALHSFHDVLLSFSNSTNL